MQAGQFHIQFYDKLKEVKIVAKEWIEIIGMTKGLSAVVYAHIKRIRRVL